MKAPAFVIVVPNGMAFRALVESRVLPLLQTQKKRRIIVISSANEDRSRLPENVEWRDLSQPCRTAPSQSLWRRALRAVSLRLGKLLGLDYANIAYRFNHRHGFKAHQFKRRMDKARQRREELAGNYVSPLYGRPFPRSGFLYHLAYGFYYASWQVPDRAVERFFEETPIETMVLWYVQNLIYRDYLLCIKRHAINSVGVIGSWDRLTTKGPIGPGCDRYIVNSEIMKNELIRFHGSDGNKISVVGWPQMDVYNDCASIIEERPRFFLSHGIPSDHKLILFAANSERLGGHEPGVAHHIEQQLNLGIYGANTSLMIRTYPNDQNWRQRFAHVIGRPNVVVVPAGMGNMPLLVNSLTHSDVVVCTQGSVSLDAVAFDRCVINIGFDGHLKKQPHDSVARWYEMDHYRPVVQSGGVTVVNSFKEMDHGINAFLENPNQGSDARQALRQLALEPFDGRASERQTRAMSGGSGAMNILALIPARGGSKGIPQKNLYPVLGKPLIGYTIDAALQSKSLNDTIVSTDDEAIATFAKRNGAGVPFMRPPSLAEDNSGALGVMEHTIEFYLQRGVEIDLLVYLQPTSPLRTWVNIDEAIALMCQQKGDSLVSVVDVPHQFAMDSQMIEQNGQVTPVKTRGLEQLRRQEKPKYVARNGPAVLITKPSTIKKYGSIYGETILSYKMGARESLDIDVLDDVWFVEQALKANRVQ